MRNGYHHLEWWRKRLLLDWPLSPLEVLCRSWAQVSIRKGPICASQGGHPSITSIWRYEFSLAPLASNRKLLHKQRSPVLMLGFCASKPSKCLRVEEKGSTLHPLSSSLAGSFSFQTSSKLHLPRNDGHKPA